MKRFLLALQFLTIIPIKSKKAISKDEISWSIVYFPLVGLFLGLVLVGINQLLLLVLQEQFLINIILVILLIILTGGLHLDGLADTSDAFLSRKNKSEMLEIMRDSHIGTMGVLSLISIILVKLAFLYSLDIGVKNISLILMCVVSRYFLVFAMFLFPYAREEGKAKNFITGINSKIFFLASVITLFCVIVFWQLKGLFSFILVGFFIFLIGKFITKKIGGITGDTLGAINELTEVFVLLNILILNKLWI